jgi:hypothetical protein
MGLLFLFAPTEEPANAVHGACRDDGITTQQYMLDAAQSWFERRLAIG